MTGQIQSVAGVAPQWQALPGTAPVKQASTPCVIRQATAPTSTNSQSAVAATLLEFERARVSYQETRTVEPGRSYSISATLSYERIAFSQQSSAPPLAAPPVDSAEPVATAEDSPDAPIPASATGALHHVVINATTLSYQRLSVHVTAAPRPSSNASDRAAPPAAARPAIERLDSADFSALRARTVDRSSETSLTLELKTREGDLIALTFRQLDLSSRSRISGVTDAGDRVRMRDASGSSQRYVNMQITGDLSDAEKSAIDAVLRKVIDVADQFFHGDMRAAIERLSNAQIDTEQLAEFSLKMSMSRSREMNRLAAGENGALQQFVHRDAGVSQTLEFLADQQHRLITAAKTRFDDRSAVMLVKQLLPAMIAPAGTPDDATPDADAPVEATTVSA